jgi:hypothetical protein
MTETGTFECGEKMGTEDLGTRFLNSTHRRKAMEA